MVLLQIKYRGPLNGWHLVGLFAMMMLWMFTRESRFRDREGWYLDRIQDLEEESRTLRTVNKRLLGKLDRPGSVDH
jgi:hypothetical protein